MPGVSLLAVMIMFIVLYGCAVNPNVIIIPAK
jgi:hypothetical protein